MFTNKLYCSSSCFIAKTWKEIFFQAQELDLDGLELSFFNAEHTKLEEQIASIHKKQFFLLAHNFFNAQHSQLVINICDPCERLRQESVDFILQKLQWCAQHQIKRYSFHAGFAASVVASELGSVIPQKSWSDVSQAKKLFIENMRLISKKAQELQVEIAVENNVLTKANCLADFTHPLLCVYPQEVVEILEEVTMPNVKLLLDVGHLYVSSKTLNFSFVDAVKRLLPYTSQIHLHANNGITDSHSLPDDTLLAIFAKFDVAEDVDIVLEFSSQPLKKIQWCISTLKNI